MSGFATNLTKAVYDVMANDATLTAMLATYQGAPAIFTGDKIPEGADYPRIISQGCIMDAPYDNKEVMGREVMKDIRCYARSTSSMTEIEEIAERVRTLFHEADLTITGYSATYCHVTGVIPAPTSGPHVVGRIVTIHVQGVFV